MSYRPQTSRLHHEGTGDEGRVAGSHECLSGVLEEGGLVIWWLEVSLGGGSDGDVVVVVELHGDPSLPWQRTQRAAECDESA